jgi:5'-3' exonuclease
VKDALALIDLSGVFYPAWYSVGADSRPDAAMQAAYRAVCVLSTRWKHVAICADMGKSFRADISPSYKAQRKEKDAPMMAQLGRLVEKLEADGFPIWREPGMEADDMIAAATMAAFDRGMPVVIVTQDKDLWQLVDDDAGVAILSLPKDVIIKSPDVRAKFGVDAHQMGDFLALVGDVSDNIQGAKGVGEKTAAKLLNEIGNLGAVMQAAKDGDARITDHIRQKLINCEKDVELARALVTLGTSAPIDLDAALQPRVKKDQPRYEDAMNENLESDTPQPPPATPAPEPVKPIALVQPTPTHAAPPQALTTRQSVLEDAAPAPAEWAHQLEPRSPRDAVTMAKWIYESQLYRAFDSPQAIFSVILAGRELGLTAMASLRGFHVVEGRPTIAADLLRSLVLRSGKAQYFTCTERTAERSTWTTKRVGDMDAVTLSYTMAEAQQANLVRPNSGWAKHPADMLAKSASTKLARLVYPDVAFSLYAPEELGGEAA